MRFKKISLQIHANCNEFCVFTSRGALARLFRLGQDSRVGVDLVVEKFGKDYVIVDIHSSLEFVLFVSHKSHLF